MDERLICTACKQNKDIIEFTNGERKKGAPRCRACVKAYNIAYREKNIERLLVSDREYYYANQEKLVAGKKAYYAQNKDIILPKNKEYRQKNAEPIKKQKQSYYDLNRESILEKGKVYITNNKEKIVERDRRYYENNKEKKLSKAKEYYEANKSDILKQHNEYASEKIRTDPVFKCRQLVSCLIYYGLRKNGSSKNNKSSWWFLPYSPTDLKQHLESLFETWMNWDNWGVYRSKIWNDNDSSTWTWQLDHIIPQADLPYTSMDGENFDKCWALENLRPYSAKLNILDGISRVRHNKIKDKI